MTVFQQAFAPQMKRRYQQMFALVLLQGILLQAAATGLPWEAPLATLLTSLSGPVALVIAAVCCIFVGFQIGFRPDPLEYGKMALLVPFAMAFIVGAATVIKVFFPAFAGAVI